MIYTQRWAKNKQSQFEIVTKKWVETERKREERWQEKCDVYWNLLSWNHFCCPNEHVKLDMHRNIDIGTLKHKWIGLFLWVSIHMAVNRLFE